MYNFFLIGNQKTNINDKKIRGKYTMFMMMNNKKKKSKQHNKKMVIRKLG